MSFVLVGVHQAMDDDAGSPIFARGARANGCEWELCQYAPYLESFPVESIFKDCVHRSYALFSCIASAQLKPILFLGSIKAQHSLISKNTQSVQ